MFDSRTAALLRSAPDLPGLDAGDLPRSLTRQYAALVSRRLRGDDEAASVGDAVWPLDRIADAYEMIAALETEPELRRASAFVAGTAQQIIARRAASEGTTVQLPVDRDSVDASVAAALLFLSAEQYADAHEAAGPIVIPRAGMVEARELGRHVRDLARGNLEAILKRAEAPERRRSAAREGRRLETTAQRLLLSHLALGIEHLARYVLASGENPGADLQRARNLFRRVLGLGSRRQPLISLDDRLIEAPLTTSYPGPAHLASLLLSVADGIAKAPLTKLPPPDGADAEFWKRWLAFRARTMPFVWRNHREAIAKQFYETARSAVLVLPTGAGKTTVSVLKIAGVLARGKKVVFLAPTHALVEQLTEDLQALFPEDQFEREVSGDFDSLLVDNTQLKDIEVMTPERCLAMLSFAPDAFASVGLLVFDECHLLSPSRRIGRALDSMLCLLAFQATVPDADMLLLSAMIKNGDELADWIASLTGRPCEAVELLWKPSRQARGVVVYKGSTIRQIEAAALKAQHQANLQAGKRAKSLRGAAKAKLKAQPAVLWGLEHNWKDAERSFSFSRVTDGPVQLAAGFDRGRLWATPNSNQVATSIATRACRTGLKTIVFVNRKADAVRTAAAIAEGLEEVALTPAEQEIMDVIGLELGDIRHAIFAEGTFAAVPHHGSMLRLERKLAEDIFRRTNGAQAIVATPTLAQGLNLPAELAILAGDRRAGEDGGREDLEAHELLNAAARAGRAGHVANGIVILIPEPIIIYETTDRLTPTLQDALESVIPEDDRCILVGDPLEIVLDRVMMGERADRDVRYTVNRLAALTGAGGATVPDGAFLARSLAAFRARERGEEQAYRARAQVLWNKALEVVEQGVEPAVLQLVSQSGIEPGHLDRLRQRLVDREGELPLTVPGWFVWILDWLAEDDAARRDLLAPVQKDLNSAIGRRTDHAIDADAVRKLVEPGRAWLEGKPLNKIERLLGGDPDSTKRDARLLPRARTFTGTVIPRGLSFLAGVVSRLTEELQLPLKQFGLSEQLLKSLAACVRRGFDEPIKLDFATMNRKLIGRVQVHKSYAEQLE